MSQTKTVLEELVSSRRKHIRKKLIKGEEPLFIKQLLDINKEIIKLVGKKVAESVYINEYPVTGLCSRCKKLRNIIWYSTCFSCK